MPRVPTPISAEARINAAREGEVPWEKLWRKCRASGQGFDFDLSIPRVPTVFPGMWMSYPASRLQRTRPLVALFLELPLSPQPQA